MIKTCQICGIEFNTNNPRRLCCSPECEHERVKIRKSKNGFLKPFDLHIGDMIKTLDKRKLTVTGIYQHHFTATNKKWTESFTKAEYQTGEVRKIDK